MSIAEFRKLWVSGRRFVELENAIDNQILGATLQENTKILRIVALTPGTKHHQSPSFSLKTPSSPHSTLPRFGRVLTLSFIPSGHSDVVMIAAILTSSSTPDSPLPPKCPQHHPDRWLAQRGPQTLAVWMKVHVSLRTHYTHSHAPPSAHTQQFFSTIPPSTLAHGIPHCGMSRCMVQRVQSRFSTLKLKLFVFAGSLGGVELPAQMTHASLLPAERKALGIEGLLRLSCGIEEADDLRGGLVTLLNIPLHRLSAKQGACKYSVQTACLTGFLLPSLSLNIAAMHAKAESSVSAKQRAANKGQPSDSSRPVAPQKREKYPPPYGAQHRQDALWEGGNEALPPMWTEYEVEGDGQPLHLDGAVFMTASHRPLPGVRLDYPGLLIPGCEWYISPLGRSYFVNHNTQTTSWKKPTIERPAGSLMPERIIRNGSPRYNGNLACLVTSGDILGISNSSIRQWTRAGQPVGKPLDYEGGVVITIAVSPDGLMVADGRVRLWNIEEGSLVGHPWEGNNDEVLCLDWSPNGTEVAGGSQDGTIRRWNTTTGRQLTPPIKRSDKWVWAIKYSPQGDKFASSDGAHLVSASVDYSVRIWDLETNQQLGEPLWHDDRVFAVAVSIDGQYIASSIFGPHAKIYVWSLEAALERVCGDGGRVAQSRDVR
ncbi:hypothetical protein P692DRAFT_201910484 [Suillus brevipes Sb2]|nr:hypothetical protein P692DRAFT_201910484 [Suillus brevipes Sb2]